MMTALSLLWSALVAAFRTKGPMRTAYLGALALTLALGAFAAWRMSRHQVQQQEREQAITRAETIVAAIAPKAKAALAESNRQTAHTQRVVADYQAQRSAVVIDSTAGTITVAGARAEPLPAAAAQLIASADTVIPQLVSALGVTRAGWALDREARDSLASVVARSTAAPSRRCGARCGITLGVLGTIATYEVVTRVVLPRLRARGDSTPARAASLTLLRLSVP